MWTFPTVQRAVHLSLLKLSGPEPAFWLADPKPECWGLALSLCGNCRACSSRGFGPTLSLSSHMGWP